MRTPVRSALIASAALLVASCNSNIISPTGPVPFTVDISSPNLGTTFSATIATDTTAVTTFGAYSRSLVAGTYNVTGTFTGPGITVAFKQGAAPITGGVQLNSAKSLDGPANTTSVCAVAYNDVANPQGSHTFTVQFVVIEGGSGFCQ